MTDQITISNPDAASDLHFVIVPVMAQGHMIPLIDIARLIAARGVVVTVVTTPLNALRLKTLFQRIQESNISIRFLSLRFPATEAGLPEGSENIDTLPSISLAKNFLEACSMLKDPLIAHLKAQHPPPSCIVSDLCLHWTREVAQEFGIPRFFFHGYGCFAHLSVFNIRKHNIHEIMADEDEPFVVPGLIHEVTVTRAQAPELFFGQNMKKIREEIEEAEAAADGVVVNSFEDLEPSYSEWLGKAMEKKVWTIGPSVLCTRNVADMAARGNKADIDEHRCLRWLDSKKQSSVLYVSFGSMDSTMLTQISELGLSLEASNRPFIWVIKAGDKAAEVEEWLAGGFEERIGSRGLIIRGWAPQAMILSHKAVGGFMTHCGWNSTLEAVTAGVPMITWPRFGDQFLNEKLIVQVLKIGVPVGVKYPTGWSVEKGAVLISRDDIGKAVACLMDEGGEGEERRRRAKALGEKAEEAMKVGGSSYENLSLLIQSVVARSQTHGGN